MRGFRDVLMEVSRGLAVDGPTRERVLRELAGDLEGLYREALEAGLDEEAARERALEFVEYDPGVQAAMVEVHGPWHRRWSSTLPEVARTRLERFALLAAFLAVVLLWFRYRGDRLELETWWPPLVGGRTLGLLGISLVFLWLRSGWKRFIDNDHRPDPYEETAVLASGLVTICAGLGLLGLLLCVGRAGLDLNGYTGTDGVALLREQLVHLRGQLAVVSTYLGMTCFGLVTHARIVAAARHYRAQEDDLLDELAQPEQPVLGDRQPTPTTTP